MSYIQSVLSYVLSGIIQTSRDERDKTPKPAVAAKFKVGDF
jgi:hypothetical protein